jgi:23S rRNA U2552 (ribose-2'-O)-methylase RlmE/FtsJ
MNSFETLFKQHREKYTSKWRHYFSIYDRHLSDLIGKEFTLIEIGVNQGGSLQLWKKYFGNKVKIIGIDKNNDSYFEESQIKIFIGDQSDEIFLKKIINSIDSPTVIIDDGSHIQSHILKSLNILYPALSFGGTYIIEDCHTSYWPRFEGGVNSHLNIVEILSRSTHDVNTRWYNLPKIPILSDLNSICFYDSMIVLEKQENNCKRMSVDADSTGARIIEVI